MPINRLLEIAALPIALIVGGIIYQALGARRDRDRYTRDGRLITLPSGSSHFIVPIGSGKPTVIFEAGISATNLNWRHIQEVIAQTNATVSYDRGGLGWSSAASSPRIPSNLAIELHDLLDQAGVIPPYILVGHSFGGLLMRRFALQYPGEAVGMVLVDPMRCEEWPPLKPSRQSEINRGRTLLTYATFFSRIGLSRLILTVVLPASGTAPNVEPNENQTGIHHALARLRSEVNKMAPSVRPVVAAHWSRPAYYAGMRSYIEAIPDTVREMQTADRIRNIPIVVITPGSATPLTATELSAIGHQARQRLAPSSKHWVHLDEPQIVIDAIRSLLDEVNV